MNDETIQDLKHAAMYSDEELIHMEYSAIKAECSKLREEREKLLECAMSWRRNFEELKAKHEELQNLFVETDDELNEYRDKFVNEAIQHEYLKNDYENLQYDILEIKSRLSKVEFTIKKS